MILPPVGVTPEHVSYNLACGPRANCFARPIFLGPENDRRHCGENLMAQGRIRISASALCFVQGMRRGSRLLQIKWNEPEPFPSYVRPHVDQAIGTKVECGHADQIIITLSNLAASCNTLHLPPWTCVNACPGVSGESTGSSTEHDLNGHLPLPFYLPNAKSSALGPEPDILCMTSK